MTIRKFRARFVAGDIVGGWIEDFQYTVPKSDIYTMLNCLSNVEVTQYIGHKDRHEVEMYEGDIVKYLDNTSKGLVTKVVPITDILWLPDFSCSKWEEIIGNKYDTPELWKELLEQ